VRYLLDTHAALWAIEDDARLGANARQLIADNPTAEWGISDMTLLEVALLASKGRIEFAGGMESKLAELGRCFRVLPIDPSIATDAVTLDLPQSDPFDRIIVATARRYQLTLLSRDRLITQSGLIETIW